MGLSNQGDCKWRNSIIEKSFELVDRAIFRGVIIHFCDQQNIDVESVPKLISKPLKDKLKAEAMELNFLKRSSRAKLPL